MEGARGTPSTEPHEKSIPTGYRSFDRILRARLIQPFQQSERVMGFFSVYRKLFPVTREGSDRYRGPVSDWVKDRAQKWDAPILDARR